MRRPWTLVRPAAAVILLVTSSAFAAPPLGTAVAEAAPHEAPPAHEWVKAPVVREADRTTGGIDGHCGFVERDGYVSVQVNVDLLGRNIVGDAANEPSIAIDPTEPRKMVIGWRQFDSVESDFRQAGYGFSHDGGRTWNFAGVLSPGLFRSDPVLESGPDGTIYYFGFGLRPEETLYRSKDGGVTWDGSLEAPAGDKPWMTIDNTHTPSRGNIYIWGRGLQRSIDGGHTFVELPPPVTIRSMTIGPSGILFMTGSAYVVSLVDVFGSPIYLEYETFVDIDFNGGAGIGGCPCNPSGFMGQDWIAADHSNGPYHGNVYLLASFGSGEFFPPSDVLFSRSEDDGQTWSEPIPVNDDPTENLAWQWFAMMSVAPDGRIDAVWNDTRANVDAPDHRLSELYYAYSTDAGRTWSTNVPISPVFDSHVGWPAGSYGQKKIGDYYHMRSDNLGVSVAYAATFHGEQDVYFLRIGPYDCNDNEVSDSDDITGGASRDDNLNDIPDECELFGDFNGDSRLDLRDYQGMQLCIGAASADQPGPRCRRLDLDLDNDVDRKDFATWHTLGNP